MAMTSEKQPLGVIYNTDGSIRTNPMAIEKVIAGLDKPDSTIEMEIAVDLIKALAAERDKVRRLEAEAATHVEELAVLRTPFTGEPPYVGWKGIGLAIRELIERESTYKKLLLDCVPLNGDGTAVLIPGVGEVALSDITALGHLLRAHEIAVMRTMADFIEGFEAEVNGGSKGPVGDLSEEVDAFRLHLAEKMSQEIDKIENTSGMPSEIAKA
ncbi:hypothetical protein [Salipiger sp. PrR003]|uniref:hypothetical protein n=1 Tax=Salipiger sp. PrR003 TaxID=2706776 RepID=UPI0013DB8B15|nr:hypothetical protein [Salipiger sp. PrR003]NDV50582.1 hypothetical protein [Salipiger sp. PrR003]